MESMAAVLLPQPAGDALARLEARLGRRLERRGARPQEVAAHRQLPRLETHARLVDAQRRPREASAPPATMRAGGCRGTGAATPSAGGCSPMRRGEARRGEAR